MIARSADGGGGGGGFVKSKMTSPWWDSWRADRPQGKRWGTPAPSSRGRGRRRRRSGVKGRGDQRVRDPRRHGETLERRSAGSQLNGRERERCAAGQAVEKIEATENPKVKISIIPRYGKGCRSASSCAPPRCLGMDMFTVKGGRHRQVHDLHGVRVAVPDSPSSSRRNRSLHEPDKGEDRWARSRLLQGNEACSEGAL